MQSRPCQKPVPESNLRPVACFQIEILENRPLIQLFEFWVFGLGFGIHLSFMAMAAPALSLLSTLVPKQSVWQNSE